MSSFDLSLFNHAELDSGAMPPHQEAGLQFLIDHPKALLADEVGLGKTVQSTALLATLKAQHQLGTCLVAAPAHLVQQWVEELHRWVPSLIVREGAAAVPLSQPSVECSVDVMVCSYELLHRRQHVFAAAFPRTVVLDEAQNLRSGGTEHAAVLALTRDAERVVALTATPFENHAMETYQILKLLHLPGLWSQSEFERRFIRWTGEYLDGYGRVVPCRPIGLVEEELPELREFMSRCYLRRTGEELSLSLPCRVGDKVRWVPLLKSQRFAMWRADQLPAGLRRHQARERACGVVAGRSSKAEAALDEILRRPEEPKFVVWAFNRQPLDVMQGLLERHGLGSVRIDGSIRGRGREALLRRFRDEADVRVLLGTDVLGSGLNLQHARVMLSLGSSYNPGKEVQREGRIRRLGSPHATYEHITFLNDCEHERNKLTELLRKAADACAVLD